MNRHNQRGIGLLHIIGSLALLVALAVGFKTYKTSEKKAAMAKEEQLRRQEVAQKAEVARVLSGQKDKVTSTLVKWDDALKLAGMTSRVALSQPIAQMQATKREMNELKTNDCFEKSTKSMAAGMSDAIFAFEMFARYPNNESASDSTSKYLGISTAKILAAKQDLDACFAPGE